MSAHQDRPENKAKKVTKGLQDHPEIKEIRDHLVRLEKQALKENLALQDLLGQLELVLATARRFWYLKTTQLMWVTIILGLIVADRLLSLFPLIAPIVTKLL
jgi:hypothetical protein